jgi:hypothetical protein
VAVALGAGDGGGRRPSATSTCGIGSPVYLGLQSENLDLILLALAATAVVCAVLVAGRRWSLRLWQVLHGRVLAASVCGVLVLLCGYAAFVRPRTEVGRNLPPAQPTAVESLQLRAGLESDPLRSYDEQSLIWLTWYLGAAAVALGLLALVLLVWRSLRRQPSERDGQQALAVLGFLLLFGASTVLYLWRPSIIPVHYWAMRRFLPVTIPGCCCWRCGWCRGARPLALAGRRRRGGSAAGAAGRLPAGPPDRAGVRPDAGVTERLCAELEPDDAVLLVGGGTLATGMPQTLRAFCGVPVAVVDTATTLADVTAVADAAQAAGKRLVLLSAIEAPAWSTAGCPASSSRSWTRWCPWSRCRWSSARRGRTSSTSPSGGRWRHPRPERRSACEQGAQLAGRSVADHVAVTGQHAVDLHPVDVSTGHGR